MPTVTAVVGENVYTYQQSPVVFLNNPSTLIAVGL